MRDGGLKTWGVDIFMDTTTPCVVLRRNLYGSHLKMAEYIFKSYVDLYFRIFFILFLNFMQRKVMIHINKYNLKFYVCQVINITYA